VKTRGDLDAADQVKSRGSRQRLGEIVTGEGIVIGNGQRFEACFQSLVNKLRRRGGPVRFIGVRVQVDQKEISPSSSSLAHTRLALSSGL